jgi:hypothetical protein
MGGSEALRAASDFYRGNETRPGDSFEDNSAAPGHHLRVAGAEVTDLIRQTADRAAGFRIGSLFAGLGCRVFTGSGPSGGPDHQHHADAPRRFRRK